ncbi:MAG TPA: hypothetical protein VHG53_06820 [Candidatus Limnocylindria bacterium]|nr:hypothetical protein [Candidatus Limnocylindria bacterium]
MTRRPMLALAAALAAACGSPAREGPSPHPFAGTYTELRVRDRAR